ncbi:type I secretion system permease/ATPase [Segnochrobactrum spirostomi]|uniref:type I secretion system permease/ATPase n=1 Tax=Segnochrobactrum spirostomi TaxID=2608987 RepID=UPI001294DF0F|nr:type I secretion system permease/ATPase [Segnochrobactrum spirostomi]
MKPAQAPADGALQSAILAALAHSRRAFWGVALFSGIANVLMLTGPLFMLQVYDRVLVSRSMPTLVAIGLITTFLYIAYALIDFARGRVLSRVADDLEVQLAPTAFRQEVAESFAASRIEGRALTDLGTVRKFLMGPGPLALFDVPWVPLYLAVLAILHWSLGLVGVIGAVVVVAFAILTDRLTSRAFGEAMHHSIAAGGLLEGARRSAEAITALGMVPAVVDLWSDKRKAALDAERRSGDSAARVASASRAFRLFLQSATLALGAVLVIRHEATGGVMIASSITLGRALAPIDQIVAQWKGFASARSAWRRLDTALARFAAEPPRVTLPRPLGHLSVAGVIAGPPGSNRAVLQGVTFGLAPGDGIGVLGPSASGKSTLARLVVGLWKPMAGTVRLDGATLDQWNPDLLGRHIGYLPQDVELIGGTVRDCISRHAPDATDDKVIAAARAAAAHDLILRLPQGYTTRLGPGGAALSGGQRQRIALARALYDDPALIVLDEPNANLDQDGDAALTQAINTARERGAAVVVITHRPSALAAVDRILILKDGRQVACGPKDAVLRDLMQNSAAAAVSPDVRPMEQRA